MNNKFSINKEVSLYHIITVIVLLCSVTYSIFTYASNLKNQVETNKIDIANLVISMDTHLDKMDTKFNKMDTKFNKLEIKIDTNFSRMIDILLDSK